MKLPFKKLRCALALSVVALAVVVLLTGCSSSPEPAGVTGQVMYAGMDPVSRTLLTKMTHAGGAIVMFVFGIVVMNIPGLHSLVFRNTDELEAANWHLRKRLPTPVKFKPLGKLRKL